MAATYSKQAQRHYLSCRSSQPAAAPLLHHPHPSPLRPWPGFLPPQQVPTLREINAAIRDDLAAQGPGTLEAAEAAARREARGGGDAGAAAGGGLPDMQALEQALMGGEMAALRAYLEQLQARLSRAEQLPLPAEALPAGAACCLIIRDGCWAARSCVCWAQRSFPAGWGGTGSVEGWMEQAATLAQQLTQLGSPSPTQRRRRPCVAPRARQRPAATQRSAGCR